MQEKLRESRKDTERLKNSQFLIKEELKKKHQVEMDECRSEVQILRSENESLKKKIKKMQDSLVSPNPGNIKDKILNRLLHESPMPEEFRPRAARAVFPGSPEVVILSSPEANESYPRVTKKPAAVGSSSTTQQKISVTKVKSVPATSSFDLSSRQPLAAKNSFNGKLGLSSNLNGNMVIKKKTSSLKSASSTGSLPKSTSSLFEPTRTSRMVGGDSLRKRLYESSQLPAGMVYNGLGGTVKADHSIRPKKIYVPQN